MSSSTRIWRLLLAAAIPIGIFGVAHSQTQPQAQVGYAIVTANVGMPAPVTSALFTYSNSAGIIVSQAGVGSAPPFLRSRLFVDERGTRTGVALVNTSAQAATVNMILRDSAGGTANQGSLSLNPGEHRSRFIDELFTNLPANFTGSVTFDSNQPLSSITLRERKNSFGEPLYATLPVVDLSAAGGSQLVFPHLAAGEGYLTQLILFNRGSQTANGQVRFFGASGAPLVLRANGNNVSELAYAIPPDGVYQVELDSPSGLTVGYATLNAATGSTAPAGTVIFRFVKDNTVVTEAAVAGVRATTLFRVFVDYLGSRTGVALANASTQAAEITLRLMDRYGTVDGATTISLPAGAHIAKFADEFFSNVSDGFSGLMEVQSSIPVVPITLKLRVNARFDQVLTTLPVADLTVPPVTAPVVLPQIAIGEGFSTRLIFLHPGSTAAANGQVRFVNSDGTRLILPMGGETGDNFAYGIAVGNGRQLYPGNTATIASVNLLDSGTGQPTDELIINEGRTIRPRLRIVDNTGAARDDFVGAFQSLNQAVATVDATGLVRGVSSGFSTLAISVNDAIATAAATVVKVDSGVTGYNILGVAQDLAKRLYLAAPQDHAILRLENLAQVPAVYAGVQKSPGLKNDVRLQSQFRGPSFIAFDGADGSLYVSDSANHVIRRIRSGQNEAVETVAGTGAAGSLDGPAAQAAFNNPQGVSLDGHGYLWIADSGNHTIRRLNLVTRTVSTVAGKAGTPGNADGVADQARFRNPSGVAVVNETAEEQLERELLGQPPPPVEIVVADTGNNAIRGVDATGSVSTFSLGTSSPILTELRQTGLVRRTNPAVTFGVTLDSPTGIGVDTSGNVYFTEPNSRVLRVLLRRGTRSRTGTVVNATPPNTLQRPQALAVGPTGDVLITDSFQSIQRIQFGAPQITEITPDRITTDGRQTLVLTGSNFDSNAKVYIGGTFRRDAIIVNTQTIRVPAPVLPSGTTTVSVFTRAGIAHKSLVVEGPRSTGLAPGSVTTAAGGSAHFGDGGAPTAATLVAPAGLALGSGGIVYSVERLYHRIRKIDRGRGLITTVAGNGQEGFSGDGGPAVAATLDQPIAAAVDSTGNLFITDTRNNRIRKVDVRTGLISTVAGAGPRAYAGDNGLATMAMLNWPDGIAIDSEDNIFVADSGNHRVRKIDAKTGIITTVAGTGTRGSGGDLLQATSASLDFTPALQLRGLVVDRNGTLFIADTGNNRIRVVGRSGIISTIVGGPTQTPFGEVFPPVVADLASPNGIAVDRAGNLFIADTGNHLVRRVNAEFNAVTTVAGTGLRGFAGDSQLATAARLNFPNGVAADSSGNIIISDQFNYRIRQVAATDLRMSTIAGSGDQALAADGKLATDVSLGLVDGIAVDGHGNFFLADRISQRIRRVDGVTRIITTLAGNGTLGFSAPSVLAVDTALNNPTGIAVDAAGNVYFADKGNHRIRRINAVSGAITTVAGSGKAGFSGDGGPADQADLDLRGLLQRHELAFDAAGNLYLTDTGNQRIRRVDAITKNITTVAGNGQAGFSGDGGLAVSASLSEPTGLAIDGAGNIFIGDAFNQRVRRVDAASRRISTYAGDGPAGPGQGQFSGDGGLAPAARFNLPVALAIDSAGNLFIADALNHRIRRVSAATGIVTTIAGTGVSGFSGDGASATLARFNFPSGLAFDSSGNLYIADTNNYRVRTVRGPIP